LQAIVKNFKELRQEVEKTRLALYNKFDLENVGTDGYKQRMPKFVREAGNKLGILKDEITLAQNSYTQILMYFGEETDERKQMNSMAFFGIFKTFVTSYKKARDENRKWNEARNARQKRLEVKTYSLSFLMDDDDDDVTYKNNKCA
jgi:cytokinesis protein